MELDGSEFEKKIYVKKDAAPLLAWDVAHKYSYSSEASGGAQAGSHCDWDATDPYQPAEPSTSDAVLPGELAKRDGLSVSIITKSNHICGTSLCCSGFLNGQTWGSTLRLPRACGLTGPWNRASPRPDLRLAAVKQLRAAGFRWGYRRRR